ncbi:hypothetical protein KC460_00965 [Candidatus Dependentiae bacterium]|nr:hypothetical protein [Candidatus Dependentiae bacterium]
MSKYGLSGYSLISFLMYLMSFSVLSLIVFEYGIHMNKNGFFQQHTVNSIISLSIACDVLMRDICQAPAQLVMWKECSQNMLIWRFSNKDIGWYLDNTMLVRVEGVYNKNQGSWSSKRKSVVATHIKSITFIPRHTEDKKKIRAVDIVLISDKGQQRCRKQTINLINRVLA